MNVYDLAEHTLELTRAVIRLAENTGHHHYTKELRSVEAELSNALALVEASEMVDAWPI